MNLKTFIIANPSAGNGQVGREWDEIERKLRNRIPTLDWAFTEGQNHATLLAREAFKDGWEMVVAVGGDGTINEVVNGFYEKPSIEEYAVESGWMTTSGELDETIIEKPVLGIIPIGTGGDFRRSVGLMGGINDSIERLASEKTKTSDLGKITYIGHDGKITSRYFANIASAGLSGEVDKVANNMWKGFGGKTSFAFATLRAGLAWKNFMGQIIIDDVEEIEGAFQNIVIANGSYFGGGMWIAPGGSLDSGFFETVLIGDLSTVEGLKLMRKVYSGTHFEISKIKKHKAKKVAVKGTGTNGSVLLDVDGEQPGRLPALFELHESAIQIKY